MFISKNIGHAADRLERVTWKQVGLILFHGLIALMVGTYVAGETLGLWVHRTNDFLAANWVRMLGLEPSNPTKVGQAPVITEEVSVHTPPTVEVEPMLPPVAEVVEIPVLDEQPPPPARRRRSRNSASNALEETVTEEAEPATNRRPRGRRAHAKRNRAVA